MYRKHFFLIFFLLIGFLLFSTESVEACQCGDKQAVLDSFEASDNVIIAEISAIEKATADAGAYRKGDVKGIKVFVKKVFKGTMKIGDSVFFDQGGGSDCLWVFNEITVGTEMLIYDSDSGRKGYELNGINGCGRSTDVKQAGEDLLYLENLDKVRGKTRISGAFAFKRGGESGKGKKVKIIGKDKTYEAITDKNGVYEIYDLPAGEYIIEPEVPKGLKVSFFSVSNVPNGWIYKNLEKKKPTRFRVTLEEKRHVSLDFFFDNDN